MKVEIKAIGRLVGIDPKKAAYAIRRNPLFGDEIHINEELINLDETLRHYLTAETDLGRYPKLQRHLKRDLRAILTHCVGLVWRMSKGKPLPHAYDEESTAYAVQRLCRIVIGGAIYAKQADSLDREAIEALHPLMGWRQRLYFETHPFAPVAYLRVLLRRPLAQNE